MNLQFRIDRALIKANLKLEDVGTIPNSHLRYHYCINRKLVRELRKIAPFTLAVKEMSMNTRIHNALENNNIKLENVPNIPDSVLLEMKEFGKQSLKAIRKIAPWAGPPEPRKKANARSFPSHDACLKAFTWLRQTRAESSLEILLATVSPREEIVTLKHILRIANGYTK